jgi:putative addiction module component (TIGR02574 family)
LIDRLLLLNIDLPIEQREKMTDVTFDRVCGDALTLPPLYRAMLAEHLLNSLDRVAPEIEAAWSAEITNRIEEINQNTVTLVPAEEVLSQLRNR